MNIKTLQKLESELPFLLDKYSPDPDGSDYVCMFCGNRAQHNDIPVVHREDCLGIELLAELKSN